MKGLMNTQLGAVMIDPEVIARYAGSVAVECFGIVGMAMVNMKDGLVKLLKGLLKPVNGSIYYGDKNVAEMTVAMLAGEVGYIFQNPDDQIFKSNVLDEVMFGPLNIGRTKEEAKQKAQSALALVGLENKAQENPYDLELSERKMVAIASVVAMDTQVVIFDEPTIAQDYPGKEKIRQLIGSLWLYRLYIVEQAAHWPI